jgi:shikimate kinase
MASTRRYGLMMGWNVKKTIVMVGMMGAGKTAVGRALATRLGVPFIDSDAEIELAANASIAEIFQRDGEAFFRAKETQVIERLLGGESGILYTGGGAFMQPANRQMISAQGVSVWLDAPLPLLWQRVRHKDTRPLLRTPDPHATLAAMFEERVPVYALADLRVPVLARYSIEDTVDAVIAQLQTRPDVLAKEMP